MVFLSFQFIQKDCNAFSVGVLHHSSILQADDVVDKATEKINSLLDSFMGINDAELGEISSHVMTSYLTYALFSAQSVWEVGSTKKNPHEFAVAIDESDLGAFGFTDDFIFDLWGAINDAKEGRLKKDEPTEFNEQF